MIQFCVPEAKDCVLAKFPRIDKKPHDEYIRIVEEYEHRITDCFGRTITDIEHAHDSIRT